MEALKVLRREELEVEEGTSCLVVVEGLPTPGLDGAVVAVQLWELLKVVEGGAPLPLAGGGGGARAMWRWRRRGLAPPLDGGGGGGAEIQTEKESMLFSPTNIILKKQHISTCIKNSMRKGLIFVFYFTKLSEQR